MIGDFASSAASSQSHPKSGLDSRPADCLRQLFGICSRLRSWPSAPPFPRAVKHCFRGCRRSGRLTTPASAGLHSHLDRERPHVSPFRDTKERAFPWLKQPGRHKPSVRTGQAARPHDLPCEPHARRVPHEQPGQVAGSRARRCGPRSPATPLVCRGLSRARCRTAGSATSFTGRGLTRLPRSRSGGRPLRVSVPLRSHTAPRRSPRGRRPRT